jgi:HEAT repeat protein
MLALKDNDGSVRASAAWSLGEMREVDASEALAQALKSRDKQVRQNSIEALKKIGEPAVNSVVGALRETDSRAAAAEILAILGAPAVPPLVQLLDDNNHFIRGKAAEVLGEIGDGRATKPLIGCVTDKQNYVRIKVAEALGKIGNVQATEPLVTLLSEGDKKLRLQVMIALGKLKSVKAVEPLARFLKDEDIDIRWRAVHSLEEIGDASAGRFLAKALGDSPENFKPEIFRALGKVGDLDSLELALKALLSENRDVRNSAAKALESLNWTPKDDVEKAQYLIAKEDWNQLVNMGELAVEPLVSALGYDSVRSEIAETLGKREDRRAIEPLNKLLATEEHSWIRNSLLNALEKIKHGLALKRLTLALADDNPKVRLVAVTALGEIADQRTVEKLASVLQDENEEVRNLAREALEKIKARKSQ